MCELVYPLEGARCLRSIYRKNGKGSAGLSKLRHRDYLPSRSQLEQNALMYVELLGLLVNIVQCYKVLISGAAEDGVIVVRALLHLFDGDLHAALDLVFGVGAAPAEPGFQLFDGGRHDKDGGDFAFEKGVVLGGLAHLSGALHIDVEEEIGAGGELVLHLAFEGAVEVTMNVGVFVEIACCDLGLKGVAIEEVVIDGVDFAGAWLAGGGSHDALHAGHFLQHPVADGRLSATGRPRYDQ